jgi:hypothetical protein
METHATEIQPESPSTSPAAAPTSPAITTTVAPTEVAAPTVPKNQPDVTAAPAATHPADTSDPAHTAPTPTTKPKRTTSQLLGLPPTEREEQGDEDTIAEDTVRLAYELVLHGGRDEVVRIKSQLVLPLALEVENLAQTDVSFPELFDQVIVRPLVAKFRAFLQRRFDAASRAEAEAKAKQAAAEVPMPANLDGGYKPSKPSNGTTFTMPEINPRPPLPQGPGGAVWRGPNSGT